MHNVLLEEIFSEVSQIKILNYFKRNNINNLSELRDFNFFNLTKSFDDTYDKVSEDAGNILPKSCKCCKNFLFKSFSGLYVYF